MNTPTLMGFPKLPQLWARIGKRHRTAVLLLILAVTIAGCDEGAEEETAGVGWCNTECSTCGTEISRTQGPITIANTGNPSYMATMEVTWSLCCCNTCYPTVWLDDLKIESKTTLVTWDTGATTTRPPGAANTAANNSAAAKLAEESAPFCP